MTEEMKQTHKFSLTKENFWNALEDKYPLGVADFKRWINEYKEAVDWKKLFNEHTDQYNGGHEIPHPAPKYHELPAGLQFGVYMSYVLERGGCSCEIDLFEFDLEEFITKYTEMVQKEMEIDQ